ncbi:MFS transporter [Actinoallomurus bryophytorum]|uniref:MFS transporter n=1 Tax=Actinoallomurus bryophytorum TaxID=1490222 RepID=A0A543CJC8_9ACTN|nr:MFS transporter [Actinoallomurus bryophytorum]
MLALLTVVELLVFLDTSVVNVALPSIGAGLGLSVTGLAWVTGAYQLTFGGFQLVGGRAADLLGRRRMFVTGLTVFTVASLLAGVARWAWLLPAARALQGVGAALLVPAEIALLAVTFTDPKAHAKAFGIWSAMGAAGAAIGTSLGGILTQAFGWQSIFLVNLPIGAVSLLLCGRLLPADELEPAAGTRWRGLDLPGVVTGTTALLLIVYAITASAQRGPDAVAFTAATTGLVLGVVFFRIEARTASPVLALGLLRVRNVTGSALANFMIGVAHVPAFFLLALYLQQVRGYAPTASGFAVLPVAAGALVFARTLLPRALARYGPRTVLAAGMLLLAGALAGFARLPLHGSYLRDVLPFGLLLAAGLPASFAGSTIPAVRSVPAADVGVVSGIVQTAQRVGSALGATGATAVIAAWTAHHAGPHLAVYNTGLRVAFATAAGVALLGVALTLLVIRTVATDRPVESPAPSGLSERK